MQLTDLPSVVFKSRRRQVISIILKHRSVGIKFKVLKIRAGSQDSLQDNITFDVDDVSSFLVHVFNEEDFDQLTYELQKQVHILCRNAVQAEFKVAVDGAESFNVVYIQRTNDFKILD